MATACYNWLQNTISEVTRIKNATVSAIRLPYNCINLTSLKMLTSRITLNRIKNM